jgi:glutathione S-transferase
LSSAAESIAATSTGGFVRFLLRLVCCSARWNHEVALVGIGRSTQTSERVAALDWWTKTDHLGAINPGRPRRSTPSLTFWHTDVLASGLRSEEALVKLYMVGASPFARKVRVLAAERGILDDIEIVIANPHERPPELVAINPLSKVPTLVDDDGTAHVDSLPICIYLDTLGGREALVLRDGPDRFPVLQRHAFAHGVMEASVTRRVESLRAVEADRAAWMDRQLQSTNRTLDRFEQTADDLTDSATIDALTLACALSYLDFRFPQDEWRASRPRLADWHAAISERPSLRATEFYA